ncbi:MAG: Crp/Fnr family transcriptional regulator [Bacteroidales bacterium]|nr:Crp/Fnr family transcriptional regulator [Bacteroidales bacterium]
MKLNLVDHLSQTDLFSNIDKTEVEVFLEKNVYNIKEYTKNDVFALAGDKVNYLMLVIDGSLIARMVSESGKYIQIDKIDAGRIVAPAMLFASQNVFPVNVIPEENTSVFFMHRDCFLSAMHRNEKLLHNFIQIVSDINRFLSTKIHSLSLKSIRGKLAEYILQESDKIGGENTIRLTLSKQELADKFAVTRQALSRSLSELEDAGMIIVKGREITIINKGCLSKEE